MSRKLFEYHPVAGYRFIPGVKARIEHEGGGFLVRVNQAGFRCEHEFAREKPAGVFRVLLFGDSFTAGEGVSNKDRFGDVLERLIPGIEVYNFGLSGSGTDQQYLIYREIGRGLEHDLVVAALQIENIRRVAARYRPFSDEHGKIMLIAKPYYTLEADGGLTLHQVPPSKEPIDPERLDPGDREHVDWAGKSGGGAWLRKVVNRLGPRAKDLAQKLSRYQLLPELADAEHPSWKLLKAVLRMWAETALAPLIVFPIPVYTYVEGASSSEGYSARFEELARTNRLVVHDPLEDLRRYSRSERRGFRFEHDTHPTVTGHRALAESLAKAVRPFVERRQEPKSPGASDRSEAAVAGCSEARRTG